MSENENGFSEYKKLFLSEFERLNENYKNTETTINELKQTIQEVHSLVKITAIKVSQLETNDNDKEERIRSLEKDRWRMFGGLSVIMVVINVILKLI